MAELRDERMEHVEAILDIATSFLLRIDMTDPSMFLSKKQTELQLQMLASIPGNTI